MGVGGGVGFLAGIVDDGEVVRVIGISVVHSVERGVDRGVERGVAGDMFSKLLDDCHVEASACWSAKGTGLWKSGYRVVGGGRQSRAGW